MTTPAELRALIERREAYIEGFLAGFALKHDVDRALRPLLEESAALRARLAQAEQEKV